MSNENETPNESLSESDARGRRFRAALALRDQTMEAWAEANEVSYSHLFKVLRDARESAVVVGRIDAFITEVFGDTVPSAAA